MSRTTTIRTTRGARIALTFALQKRKGERLLPEEAAGICGIPLYNQLRAEIGLQPLFKLALEELNGHNRYTAKKKKSIESWQPTQPR